MPGREEGRRNSEDEQEQDKASQQLALSAPSGCNEGTPASSLELDLPRVRVHMVKAEEQGSQVQQRMSVKDFYQTPQLDVPQRKKMLHRRTCEGTRLRELIVKKENEKRNSQGRDPWTFEGNSQGGDLSLLITISQGEDPRTFKEPVERWRVQTKWKEKKWKKKNASERDKHWASQEDCFFPYACGGNLAVCQRRSRSAAKDRYDG